MVKRFMPVERIQKPWSAFSVICKPHIWAKFTSNDVFLVDGEHVAWQSACSAVSGEADGQGELDLTTATSSQETYVSKFTPIEFPTKKSKFRAE